MADILSNRELYYRFDGNTLDSSGNARTGTFLGTGPTYTTGKVNQALTLSAAGTTGVTIASSPAALGNGGAVSAFAWVKLSAAQPAGVPFLSCAKNAANYDGWFLRRGGSAENLEIFLANSGVFTSQTHHLALVEDGTWSHIGFTYDGTTVTLWQNGVAGTTTIAYPGGYSPGTGFPFNVGFFSGGPYMTGLIDEVRVYSRGLATADVAQLYSYHPSLKTNNMLLISGTSLTL